MPCARGIVLLTGVVLSSWALADIPPVDYKGMCTDAGCHDGYQRFSVVHAPVTDGTCDACHAVADAATHKFEFVEEGAELCLSCHDEHEGATIHKPVEDGKCTTCHEPHGGNTASLLKAPSVAELCSTCHADTTKNLAFLHGPVAAGACTICHDAHAAEHAALLSVSGTDLCTKCHEPMKKRLSEGVFVHTPVREDCVLCHNPHGGQERMNLKLTPPELCLDCHDTIADTVEDAEVPHGALTTGKSCVNCHDPHASGFEHGLRQKPMDLCLSCHNQKLKAKGSKLMDMAKLLAENPDHHGPIREKNCSACHMVHGGSNFRMLIAPYPPEFYAPFAEDRYALCFECHEVDAMLDAQTTELTNFRNGERNLHYLHVNRAVKGRTCRTCHETHASKRVKHITESVPFGEWSLPVNYKPTPNGGTCQPGCHKRYRYDRESPIENVPKPQPAASPQEDRDAQE